MTIGIIKEGKIPIDRRVPLTPKQIVQIKEQYPDLNFKVQSSDIRCFSDDDFREKGIQVVDSLDDCDIILGVKEVPIDALIPGKTHYFFSHTIKKQDYNRDLLRAILSKNITLIDWETLTDSESRRIIAFGRWAGIVGAYNALWTFGKRYNLFNIRRANECFDLEDLKSEYTKIELPKIKIAVTGGGRVARGAMEVLHGVGIRKITPQEYIQERFNEPVFTQLNSRDYNKKSDGGEFIRSEFYKSPENYIGDYIKYTPYTDVLIACAFWEPEAPVLFTREDILNGNFRTSVIADITCDIEGSIPSTKAPTTVDDPIYDYNPSEDKMEPALTDEANITVMAVDNLPCELPRDASDSFGSQFIENVLPDLIAKADDGPIHRATITKNGKLTDRYKYLENYVSGD